MSARSLKVTGDHIMRIQIIWNVTPCRWASGSQRLDEKKKKKKILIFERQADGVLGPEHEASRTTPPTKRHIPADLSPRQMMQDVHVKLRVNPRLPSQNTFNRKKKLATCYIWRTALCGAETCDNSENRSEIPGKFGNVVLKQDGDYLDRSFEKLKKYYNSQRRKEHPAYNKKGRKLTGLVISCVGTDF